MDVRGRTMTLLSLSPQNWTVTDWLSCVRLILIDGERFTDRESAEFASQLGQLLPVRKQVLSCDVVMIWKC